MKQTNSITFEKGKELKKIVEQLPQVPYFQKTYKGELYQPVFNKVELTKSVIETIVKQNGKEERKISNTFNRMKIPRMMNHKVELMNAYKQGGDIAVQQYIQITNTIYNLINKPKTEEQKNDEQSIDNN